MLVEDNPNFAESVKAYIAQVKGVKLVAHASSGPEAIGIYMHFLPHVVLMDISLGDMSGFDIAKHLLRLSQAPMVVFLSMHDTPPYRAKAKRLGAEGFISKSNFVVDLFPLMDQLIEKRLLQSLNRE